MPLSRGALVLALVPLVGCLPPSMTELTCEADSECPQGEVCFADGCGDPGRDIAVEVLPSAQGARYPQDFAISELKGTQLLQLYPAPAIEGELKQTAEEPSAGVHPYTGPVTVAASGQSKLIPGLVRTYQGTFSSTSLFALNVGAGQYTVTVTPEDPRLPPLSEPGVKVYVGSEAQTSFSFPAFAELRTLSGAIVHSALTQTPVDAVLEVQAIDSLSQQALSQRVYTGAGGVFSLAIAPNPDPLATVLLRVRPKDPAAFIPQKDFSVPASGSDTLMLELGTFGAPLTVTGLVKDSTNRPVSGATVYLRGVVQGGGTYRSANAVTATDGSFSVKMLASAEGGAHAVWIVPSSESGSSILRAERGIRAGGEDVGTFALKDKLMVRGNVYRPGSETPLAGVRVTAEPLEAVPGSPLPASGGSAETDSAGQYVLRVDPALYRLDFLAPSSEAYPRSSRFFKADPAARTPSGTLEVAPLNFSFGRVAQGEVTIFSDTTQAFAAAPLSSVRFFRLVTVDGKPGAILLGEAVSDSSGKFSLILPARTQDLRLTPR